MPADSSTPGPSRRDIAQGIAWAAPVLSTAAAAPTMTASVEQPPCACMRPGSASVFTAQAVTVGGQGAVTGTVVFNLNSAACNTGFFRPAYTIIGTGGRITWATGQAASTFTTGVTTGAGTVGQVSAFTSTFAIPGGISMPNDATPPYAPRVPASICFTFRTFFVAVVGQNVECRYEMCIPLTSPSSLGAVIFGTGTVTWADPNPGPATISGS